MCIQLTKEIKLLKEFVNCNNVFYFPVDDVPFGEVAMAPPSLSTKPKKAQAKSQVSSYAHLLCQYS